MAGEEIGGHILVTLAIHSFERLMRVRYWKCKLLNPNGDIRVSFSALLRIANAGRYLLVNNPLRRESFGPFGGAFKFHETGRSRLDEIQYREQNLGPSTDMEFDLRGFLPRKNIGSIVKWFDDNRDRESANECLCRELREEVGALMPTTTAAIPTQIEFRLVRTVEEGPEDVPAKNYSQFRLYEIYDAVPREASCIQFFQNLLKNGESHPELLLASAEELIVGRSRDGRVIGNHSAYLIGRTRHRPEGPPFAESAK